MRVLFLTERFPPDIGGVAASSSRIARAVAATGAEVDVVAWTRMVEPGRVVREEGAPRLFRMGRFRAWDSTMPHTRILLDWLWSVAPYDVVWGHYLFPGGYFAAWIARLHGVPSLVSIRGNDLEREMYPPGDFARLEWTLRNATCVTAVTKDLARSASAIAGRDDIVSLPNAVDAEVFHPIAPDAALRERLGIAPEEAVLGFSGELREKKGRQHILDALARIREVRPACLLVIGEVRPSEMPLIAGLRVIVTGHLAEPAEVNAHLQLCDVFLQPSLWDGMPNALLEAMAAGCGVIVSDAGGIPEIVTPGVDGILLPRWQLHRLHEAILEWLDAAPADRERIRQAARARVAGDFTLDGERRRLQELLAGTR